MRLINTVLGYKKRSKTKNIFSILENIMFQLSNALSIVFISLKLVKIQQILFSWAEPAKGHETLPKISRWYPKLWPKWSCGHFFDLKNDEKSSFEKMCQGVWVPLGYHFGYHYNEFLKTKKSIFWDFPHLQAYFGCRMVPKVVPQWYPNFFSVKYEVSAF